jgi:uncharacterized protein
MELQRNDTLLWGHLFLHCSARRRDEGHERAVKALENLRRDLYTTTWILTELGDALAAQGTRGTFVAFLEFVRSNPQIIVVPTTDAVFSLGVELYRRRPDKAWSLTDCISFAVMEQNGITEALTGDHHFEQAGFVALLK